MLKVAVQVTGVLEDDDGTLTEQVCEPVSIDARDWSSFVAPGGTFDASWSSLCAQIEGPPRDDQPTA